jgi:hypothetical protein
MNLANFYKINFDITQYHKFSLTEVENMIPFERDIYVTMLEEKVKKEKEERNQ